MAMVDGRGWIWGELDWVDVGWMVDGGWGKYGENWREKRSTVA